jgi:hypothetical protein
MDNQFDRGIAEAALASVPVTIERRLQGKTIEPRYRAKIDEAVVAILAQIPKDLPWGENIVAGLLAGKAMEPSATDKELHTAYSKDYALQVKLDELQPEDRALIMVTVAQALGIGKKYETVFQINTVRDQACAKALQFMAIGTAVKTKDPEAKQPEVPHQTNNTMQIVWGWMDLLADREVAQVTNDNGYKWRDADLVSWLTSSWEVQRNSFLKSGYDTEVIKARLTELELLTECLAETLGIRKQTQSIIQTKKAAESTSGRAVA